MALRESEGERLGGGGGGGGHTFYKGVGEKVRPEFSRKLAGGCRYSSEFPPESHCLGAVPCGPSVPCQD